MPKETLRSDTYTNIMEIILEQPEDLEDISCEIMDWGYMYSFSFYGTWFSFRVPFVGGSSEQYHLTIRGAWSVQNIPGSEALAQILLDLFAWRNSGPIDGISEWLQIKLNNHKPAQKE